MKENVIVTGGAGFIGSNLANRLLREGYEVHIIDDLSTGFESNVPAGARFLKADISNKKEIFQLNLPNTIDYVFHLAAQPSGEASFDDPLRDIDVNYKGTLNILTLAKEKKASRFIYSSSMSVYGEAIDQNYIVHEKAECNPASYYGCNKLSSEKLINIFTKGSEMKPTIFRLFNVYGPGQNMFNMKQGMVSIYLAYIINKSPVQVKGSLERFRDFIFVDDVVNAFLLSINNKNTFGKIVNLGTGIKTKVEDLLKIILDQFELQEFHDWVNVIDSTKGDITGLVADIGILSKCLNWKPTVELRHGIFKMKTWLDLKCSESRTILE